MKSSLPKLVLINLGVTVGLLFTLNFLINLLQFVGGQIITTMGWEGGQNEIIEDQDLAELPNYEGRRDEMYHHFRETDEITVNYAPFIGWKRGAFEGQTITINQQGNRVHDPLSPATPVNQPKVYIFGGSTVWGTGATDNETIPAFYQEIAQVPTINQGESAYISRQSLIALINLLSAETPTAGVIFYEGVNDVQYGCRAELQVNDHARTQVFQQRLRQQKSSRSTAEKFGAYLNVMFLSGIQDLALGIGDMIDDTRSIQRRERSLICDDDPARARQVAEALLANWEMAHSMVQERGIPFLAVLQPVSYVGDPKLDHIQDDLNPEMAEQYQAVYPILQRLIQERNDDWVRDYTPLLSRDEYIYIDFCHVSANGNEILGRQLAQDTALWRE